MKYVLHIDGGARGNPGPAGAGVALQDEHGNAVFEAGYFLGRMTNNMAEYHGLLKGLDAAIAAGAKDLTILSDSELLVFQVNGDYRVRNSKLIPLFDKAVAQLRQVGRWTVRHVPRAENHRADELANLAMDAGQDTIVLSIPPRPAAATAGRAPAPSKAKIAPARHRTVVARCTRSPDTAACPAPCKTEAEFVFERTVPPGLCIDAAAQVLRAVEAARTTDKPVDVACPREGCGAKFKVRAGIEMT